MKPDAIFLTADQALAAVCADLREYEPQIPLMCNLLRLIAGDPNSIIRDYGNAYIWIRHQGRIGLQRIEMADLVSETCRRLAAADVPMATWAAICRQVFQVRVKPTKDPISGNEGLLIETQMDQFVCQRCGNCCRHLQFRHELTSEDVRRWHETNRHDILEWVAETKTAGGNIAFQIWRIPGTNQFAEVCPFLKQGGSNHEWRCAIHKVRPAICRHYPITRKHARMTGCRGSFNR
jgi:Fe-S-cluster containining protein